MVVFPTPKGKDTIPKKASRKEVFILSWGGSQKHNPKEGNLLHKK